MDDAHSPMVKRLACLALLLADAAFFALMYDSGRAGGLLYGVTGAVAAVALVGAVWPRRVELTDF